MLKRIDIRGYARHGKLWDGGSLEYNRTNLSYYLIKINLKFY